jgi:hypothetical protein
MWRPRVLDAPVPKYPRCKLGQHKKQS